MLENLARSLGLAFREQITTQIVDVYGKKMLSMEIDAVQLMIREDGSFCAASGGRHPSFEVYVDEPAISVPTAEAAIASGV